MKPKLSSCCKSKIYWSSNIHDTESIAYCDKCDKPCNDPCDEYVESMQKTKTVNYKKKHTFEDDGYGICACGMPRDIESLHGKQPKAVAKWIEEFDKKFNIFYGREQYWDITEEVDEPTPTEVKAFISNLLHQQRLEIIKEIEKMKRIPQFEPVHTALAVIYNEALDDVINLIKHKK